MTENKSVAEFLDEARDKLEAVAKATGLRLSDILVRIVSADELRDALGTKVPKPPSTLSENPRSRSPQGVDYPHFNDEVGTEAKFGVEIEAIKYKAQEELWLDNITKATKSVVPQLREMMRSEKVEFWTYDNAKSDSAFDTWKITTDLSLRAEDNRPVFGLEFVTPILRSSDGLRSLKQFVQAISGIGFVSNSTTSVHVHVSCKNLTNSELQMFAAYYVAFEHIFDQYVSLPRRGDYNRYARSIVRSVNNLRSVPEAIEAIFNTDVTKSIRRLVRLVNPKLAPVSNSSRNHKVNFTLLRDTKVGDNPRRVEFRHHHGCVDSVTVCDWAFMLVQFLNVTAKRKEKPVPEQCDESAFWRIIGNSATERRMEMQKNVLDRGSRNFAFDSRELYSEFDAAYEDMMVSTELAGSDCSDDEPEAAQPPEAPRAGDADEVSVIPDLLGQSSMELSTEVLRRISTSNRSGSRVRSQSIRASLRPPELPCSLVFDWYSDHCGYDEKHKDYEEVIKKQSGIVFQSGAEEPPEDERRHRFFFTKPVSADGQEISGIRLSSPMCICEEEIARALRVANAVELKFMQFSKATKRSASEGAEQTVYFKFKMPKVANNEQVRLTVLSLMMFEDIVYDCLGCPDSIEKPCRKYIERCQSRFGGASGIPFSAKKHAFAKFLSTSVSGGFRTLLELIFPKDKSSKSRPLYYFDLDTTGDKEVIFQTTALGEKTRQRISMLQGIVSWCSTLPNEKLDKLTSCASDTFCQISWDTYDSVVS